MAQHYRTIRSFDINNIEREVDIHQCSVTDFVYIQEGGVHIDDSYKVAAAIIEMYRWRGVTIEEQFEMIRKQIQEWDDANDLS